MTNKSGAVRDNHKYSVCNCKEKMWNDAKKSVWVNARLKHIKTESKKTTLQVNKSNKKIELATSIILFICWDTEEEKIGSQIDLIRCMFGFLPKKKRNPHLYESSYIWDKSRLRTSQHLWGKGLGRTIEFSYTNNCVMKNQKKMFPLLKLNTDIEHVIKKQINWRFL